MLSGWENYRHQADVCHAYQVLHSRGVADDNIIVMMYDDIAEHSNNTRPGTIINTPGGQDVYAGVPRGEGRSLQINKHFKAISKLLASS